MLSTVSPKLRKFLGEHPPALKALTNAFAEAFAGRTVRLYYFYTDNKSFARASHYYPSKSAVGILLLENQQPLDEFVSLVFETLNSKNEAHYQELAHKAELGNITKTDFGQDMLKYEFTAAQKARDLLVGLRFSSNEISESVSYRCLIDCPNRLDDFIDYSRRVSSPHRDPVKEIEATYDSLRKP